MRSDQPLRCAKCYLRMEPYELRIVRDKTGYHQHCFLMLLREKAKREKTQRVEAGLAKAARKMSV